MVNELTQGKGAELLLALQFALNHYITLISLMFCRFVGVFKDNYHFKIVVGYEF